MTDQTQKPNATAEADPNLSDSQKSYLERIENMKAKTKHLKFGTRLLDSTMDASTRVLRGLIREP